jgi:hypothetical protein
VFLRVVVIESNEPFGAIVRSRQGERRCRELDCVRSNPDWGSALSCTSKGAPVRRKLPSVLRYRASLGFDGNKALSLATAATVGTFRGKFAVEWFVSCWNPTKKKVLSLRTGPPAVNPARLWAKTDWGIPVSV